jgi:hypothetical protein
MTGRQRRAGDVQARRGLAASCCPWRCMPRGLPASRRQAGRHPANWCCWSAHLELAVPRRVLAALGRSGSPAAGHAEGLRAMIGAPHGCTCLSSLFLASGAAPRAAAGSTGRGSRGSSELGRRSQFASAKYYSPLWRRADRPSRVGARHRARAGRRSGRACGLSLLRDLISGLLRGSWFQELVSRGLTAKEDEERTPADAHDIYILFSKFPPPPPMAVFRSGARARGMHASCVRSDPVNAPP